MKFLSLFDGCCLMVENKVITIGNINHFLYKTQKKQLMNQIKVHPLKDTSDEQLLDTYAINAERLNTMAYFVLDPLKNIF